MRFRAVKLTKPEKSFGVRIGDARIVEAHALEAQAALADAFLRRIEANKFQAPRLAGFVDQKSEAMPPFSQSP